MPVRRAVLALAVGLLAVAVAADLSAADREKDAAKYAKILKTSKDPKALAAALGELGKLGQVMKALVEPVVPEMMAALDDKDPGVRAAAARAVGMIDPDPKTTVPALVKMLKDDSSEEARIGAAYGLANMGPAAKDARKDLQEVKKAEEGDKSKKQKMTKLGRAAQDAMRQINMKKEE